MSKRLAATLLALVAVLVTASVGSGAVVSTSTHRHIDLSTNAAVKRYLKSIGVSPRGVVIQRGLKNYAGPHCPGKGWTCTRALRVVQVTGSAGSRSGHALLFSTAGATNRASCVRAGATNQPCVIVQSAGNGVSNNAQVDMGIAQAGQTLSASQSAQVTQTSTNGSNTIHLNQAVAQLSSTSSTSVSQSQTSSQTFTVSQTSNTGAQTLAVLQASVQTQLAKNASIGTQTANGTLDGHVTQLSGGLSTASVNQVHTPIMAAAGPNVQQTVIDPFRCCATQSGNGGDTFTLTQNGTVKTSGDPSPDISAVYEADCTTSGNCNVTETQNTNGTTQTNTQSGSSVSTNFDCTGSSCVTGEIVFDGSPGTASPPATLGGYSMTPFGPDSQAVGSSVSGVSDPAGSIGFSPSLAHYQVGNGWATWSNGYTGDVYWNQGTGPTTITLPAGTKAFYLYAEPDAFSTFTIQATAQDGTTSGPVTVDGNGGAQYFGFYGTGSKTLSSITVTCNDDFAVGEFGISPAAAVIS